MYKCCIFDLDGTLVNSIYALKRSVDLTLGHFGLGPISIEDTKQFVGDGYKKLVERSLMAYGDRELTHYKEALDVYNEVFKDCCLYKVEAYEGIPQLLDFLKEHGILATVLSNKPHQRALENVAHVFGDHTFDKVYGEREALGIRKKPAPDGNAKGLSFINREEDLGNRTGSPGRYSRCDLGLSSERRVGGI